MVLDLYINLSCCNAFLPNFKNNKRRQAFMMFDLYINLSCCNAFLPNFKNNKSRQAFMMFDLFINLSFCNAFPPNFKNNKIWLAFIMLNLFISLSFCNTFLPNFRNNNTWLLVVFEEPKPCQRRKLNPWCLPFSRQNVQIYFRNKILHISYQMYFCVWLRVPLVLMVPLVVSHLCLEE